MTRLKLLVLLTVVLLAAAGLNAVAQTMKSVQVKETPVRKTPTFLGKIMAKLAYGDRVKVLKEQKSWAQVEIPGGGGAGWVNLSALTNKKVVLSAGADAEKSASSSEVALAGKGFNEEVEAKYKEDKDLDYTWVDKMEQFVFAPEELVLQRDIN